MQNRFLILLIPLGLVIFSQPLVADGFLPGIVNKTLNLLVLVGAFLIFKGNRKLLAVIIGLFFIAAIAIPLDRTTPGPTPLIIGAVAQITAMAMTMAYIAREALREEWVTKDTLMGALAVYLLIGIGLTQVYELIETTSPGAFTNLTGSTAPQIHAELTYFSLVTLTTLGYGDIAPVLPLARTVAATEAILGQFFVAAVIGLLISRRSAQPHVHQPPGEFPSAKPAKES